jgi:hypothetical protein
LCAGIEDILPRALLGDDTGTGSVSQSITDTAGQDYTLTYFLASMGDTATTFSAAWDGVTLPGSQLTNPNSNFAYVFTVPGTGTDTLTFHETGQLRDCTCCARARPVRLNLQLKASRWWYFVRRKALWQRAT